MICIRTNIRTKLWITILLAFIFAMAFTIQSKAITVENELKYRPVNYTSKIKIPKEKPKKKRVINLTEKEKQIMTQVIAIEAESESYNGKIAIANILINRYTMSKKRNMVSIIKAENQFSCISRSGRFVKRVSKKTLAESRKALDEAIYGKRVLPKDAVYYYSPKYLPNGCWASRNKIYLCTIGGHKFYSYKDKK